MPTNIVDSQTDACSLSDDGQAVSSLLAEHLESIDGLRDTGRYFHQRGWSVGTSSNYSVVLNHEPLELLVTASGMDKGRLKRNDFVRVNSEGRATTDGQPKSSAETMLHVVIAQQDPTVGAILHTHSVWATVLSDLFFADGGVTIEDYEMLKGLAGITTHQSAAWVPIFDNTQDIPAMAEQVAERWNDAERPIEHGFLIRNHGLYTWGKTLADARRHIEVYEFLFECLAQRISLRSALGK